jgi:hypothetical protein
MTRKEELVADEQKKIIEELKNELKIADSHLSLD